MKKSKYKIGDTLYWYSVIAGKVIGGKVKAINGDEYRISVDGTMWGVRECKLSKRKNVGYRESPAEKIKKVMGW
jgi:hypothetical protein